MQQRPLYALRAAWTKSEKANDLTSLEDTESAVEIDSVVRK